MAASFTTIEADILSTIHGAAFDAAAKRLALGGWGHASVLDTATCQPIWSGELLGKGLDPEDHGVMSVAAMSPSGRYAFFGADGHTGGSGSSGFFLVDLETKQSRELIEDPWTSCVAASFSPDERSLITLMPGSLEIFDLVTNGHRQVKLPLAPKSIPGVDDCALVRLSTSALLVAARNELFEVDSTTNEVTRVAVGRGIFAALARPLPDGAALLTMQDRASARHLWRYQDRALTKVATLKQDIVWVAPTGDELLLIRAEGEPRLLRKRLAIGKTTKVRWPDDLIDELEEDTMPKVLAVSDDGRRLLLASEEDMTEQVFLLALPRVADIPVVGASHDSHPFRS